MLIGFSSGRYRSEEYFLNKLQTFLDIGANVVELHPRIDSPQDFEISSKLVGLLNNKFDYISLHAPASNFVFDNSPTSQDIYKK
ncbi:MAG: hypothetical protein ACD_19C00429G0019 [uncultured bacterium]|nr:MAG: hypothetical protein ACD_19C00429G0019 [uncultured bacterium]